MKVGSHGYEQFLDVYLKTKYYNFLYGAHDRLSCEQSVG